MYQEFNNWFNEYNNRLAARGCTFKAALRRLYDISTAGECSVEIVETGTARIPDNWAGDGMSTMLFASYINKFNGRFHTVDIDPVNGEFARKNIKNLIKMNIVTDDSLKFLGNFTEMIDLLYIDSMDYSPGKYETAQAHALNEVQTVYSRLHEKSIILIDDCALDGGGKGGMLIPWLRQQGWVIAGYHYQALLVRENQL